MQRPKFAVQSKIMDFTSKVRHVVNHTSCEKHDARQGRPCYWLRGDGSLSIYAGICGNRSRKVYTGQISDFANRTKRPKKEHA